MERVLMRSYGAVCKPDTCPIGEVFVSMAIGCRLKKTRNNFQKKGTGNNKQ